MTEPKKYTLGEWITITIATPLAVIFMGITALPFVLWKSYVITILWAWFVTPYFHLPTLSVWLVYGLTTLLSLVKSDMTVKKEPDAINWKSSYAMFVIGPALSLGIGYLIHHYALHGR